MTKFGYRPKHFKLHELVDPDFYKEYSNNPDYLWRLLDDGLLEALDILRDFYDTNVTINNYYWGGQYKESGLRNPFSSTGATLSAHKFGRAFDVKVKGVNSWQVQEDIRHGALSPRFYELVNCVEFGTNGWTHIAKLNYKVDSIKWIKA